MEITTPTHFKLVCIYSKRNRLLTIEKDVCPELPSIIFPFNLRNNVDISSFEGELPEDIISNIFISGILKTSRTNDTFEPVVYLLAFYEKPLPSALVKSTTHAPPLARTESSRNANYWIDIETLGCDDVIASSIDLQPSEIINARRIQQHDFRKIKHENNVIHTPLKLLLPSESVEDVSFLKSVAAADDTHVKEDDLCLCIGDLHGNLDKLQSLLLNAGFYFGQHLRKVTFVFLGDYVDRGPNICRLLDFLIYLQRTRGPEKVVFVCGNHDFALTAFMGIFPMNDCSGTQNGYQSWRNEVLYSQGAFEKGILNPFAIEEAFATDTRILTRTISTKCHIFDDASLKKSDPAKTMHIQGRRYAADLNIFSGSATFESYNCKYADRTALLTIMPQAHKDFLANLPWVADKLFSFGRIIALHAGLVENMSLKENLKILHKRTYDAIFIEQIAGRKNVVRAHHGLVGTSTIEVSGHHGYLDISHANRCIIDESKGNANLHLAAVVFPSRTILRDSPDLLH
eukprot:m.9485 g.9485  ORF g.9485 m.9485 type:complete len:515 (-) comp3473_c0_seq1:22-1566(-)